jgi:hypothetical protein
MMLQLSPPLPVQTPKGKAWAHVLIDYGPEADLLWVCFQDETGECWTWANKDIRLQENMSLNAIRQSIIRRDRVRDHEISLLKDGLK